MKELNLKKVAIFILIVLIIVLAIVGVVNMTNNNDNKVEGNIEKPRR